MDEITLSLMGHGSATASTIKPLLDQFESQTNIRVHLEILDWNTGRSDLVKYSLYHHGPDVSEIGSTWLPDFVSMNALRLFSSAESESIGTADDFLPSAWETVHYLHDNQVWSIPFLTESNVIHYRKDLFEQANLDEQTAFSSQAHLFENAQVLHDRGIPIPFALPNKDDRNVLLQTLASWIWREGNDFVSQDGKKILLNSAEGIRATVNMFSLLHFVTPEGLKMLDQWSVFGTFYRGLAGMAVAGLWLSQSPETTPLSVVNNRGIHRFPGIPYIGGSNMAIWKHSHKSQAALELIRFLTSPPSQSIYSRKVKLLPARLKTLSLPEFHDDPILQVMSNSLKSGRSFPSVPLWGMIEDRLAAALSLIWTAYMDDPAVNLDQLVTQVLNQSAKSLNLTLSQDKV